MRSVARGSLSYSVPYSGERPDPVSPAAWLVVDLEDMATRSTSSVFRAIGLVYIGAGFGLRGPPRDRIRA